MKRLLGELKNLHFTTALSVRHARSDERVAAQCIVPQFWTSDAHEVTKGSLGQLKNLHFTTVLNVRHARSDERVARRSDKFALFWASDTHEVHERVARSGQEFTFYHSFERPTRMKWREGCQMRSLRPERKRIYLKTFQRILISSLSLQSFWRFVVFSLVFEDIHHFSRTLSSVWWQSLKTSITSAELWAVFDDHFYRHPSLQQNFERCLMTVFKDSHHFSRILGSVWWQSLKTAITSAELWAVFDDSL